MEHIQLLGIKITPGTREEICREIACLAGQKRQSFIIDANVHGINLARQLPWLAEFYQRAFGCIAVPVRVNRNPGSPPAPGPRCP